MYAFEYQRCDAVEDAASALAADPDAKLLAGGQTLLPTMKQRLANPSRLIDISRIAALKGIHREGDSLVIGAGTRHADVASSEAVRSALPALADLAGHIGDPHVRHRGTLGGSIANNDPSADYPAALLALGATVKTTKRELAAADFFTGLFETALAADEIVTEIRFPLPRGAAYVKIPNPASRYAVVGVFVARTGGGVRVAVTGAGPGVFRAAQMEAVLDRCFTAGALAGIHLSPDNLSSDLHASAEYRAHLITVAARRAVEKAA